MLSARDDTRKEEDGCACLEDIACRVRGGSSLFMSREVGGPSQRRCVCFLTHAATKKVLASVLFYLAGFCPRERRALSRPAAFEAVGTRSDANSWCGHLALRRTEHEVEGAARQGVLRAPSTKSRWPVGSWVMRRQNLTSRSKISVALLQ